jgi:hypothetical protein
MLKRIKKAPGNRRLSVYPKPKEYEKNLTSDVPKLIYHSDMCKLSY